MTYCGKHNSKIALYTPGDNYFVDNPLTRVREFESRKANSINKVHVVDGSQFSRSQEQVLRAESS